MNQQQFHIALVDDDAEFAERLVDYYTARKMKFTHFDRAETLLSELRGHVGGTPPYDLVLTDLAMPEMDGMEFTKKLKAIHPDLPVIVMTANSSVDAAIEAIEAGAADYIVKPPHFPHLTVVLQRNLHFSQIQRENLVLRRTIEDSQSLTGGIVAKSPTLLKAIELAKRVAPSDATVLITGESGTGKEVFARLIHRASNRAEQSFVAINCSAIPENLLESELFGHAKGSFTGAEFNRPGLFEEANGGTLFLDEIGDMPPQLQTKLLRVLQDRKIKRVGENTYRDVDVRIIAATLRNLGQEVKAKRFREDLFYRLNVIPIRLPSLRERKEDILPLAKYFLERFATRYSKPAQGFTREAAEWMLSHPWKGNVRELENAIERAAVVTMDTAIGLDDLRFEALDSAAETAAIASTTPSAESTAAGENAGTPAENSSAGLEASLLDEFVKESERAAAPPAEAPAADHSLIPTVLEGEPVTLADLELRYIREVLDRCEGVKDRAAKILGIDRKTLYRKLQAADAAEHASAEG
ncbi:MAG: sigma-54-dependent Fis family transcriptional regulator [Bdellovibrionales bacterium]|nr:sigma-54-dependent Fis family transcriptional regulator [Bdellovibrionales bacterium]